MTHRIEILSIIPDTRAIVRKKHFQSLGFSSKIKHVYLVDVYTIDSSLKRKELDLVTSMLTNPVTQHVTVDKSQTPDNFQWVVEVGFLPGVTDNIGSTVKQGVKDLLGSKVTAKVYSSQVTFISGNLSRNEVVLIAESLANPLIQSIHIKSHDEFQADKGMDVVVPQVKLAADPIADIVDILGASDDELVLIGKQGIASKDKTRRGPLALDLTYMQAIQSYFRKQKRNPTDVELESIAQTWSEHCKHTIFADPIDEITDGLYKTFIQAATQKIRAKKGDKDFCVSVFTDNSGAIVFDDNFLITDKAETHNSPSALDPFGGSITGIGGVNRDAIGFGLGAKPIINRYGFCFTDPKDKSPLYKGKNLTQKMLSPRQIMEGVVDGVNVGGNCSGIPTPQGFVIFDERYKAKPLVFVGTVGLIPRKSAGRKSQLRQAQPGDYIVMVGGRVGKDGIHGATFSSEALDSGSPATAVQIGDPITQKKLSDVVVKEARDLGLYTSITDNGAGGLSCSVAEMAKECGGCCVKLDDVSLKYPGLAPWEIWISESQERMTLAVSPKKWHKFSSLMKRRGVEATVIGKFTDSDKCIVDYDGQRLMDVDMTFLHDGLPPRPMKTTYTKPAHKEPKISVLKNLTNSLHLMLARLNITSFEFISQQYDHEVQGGSVIKPLQGRGKVNGDATVTRPVLDSQKAVVISQGINPSYSDIDTYHMAAAAIDTAIRNVIAAGASLDHLALMDNFCWCSSNEPERLGQLKQAVKACYDTAVLFGTPFISGKDSMFNDFKGYDADGKPVKISVSPTLLISSIAVMKDARKAVSLDAKLSGDLVYILGETHDELGASEYFAMVGEKQRGKKFIGNVVPKVDARRNKSLYKSLSRAINKGVIASAQSIHRGGLIVAVAKTAMAGKLGINICLENIPGTASRDDFKLYSESQGRIIVTVAPQNKHKFEKIMKDQACSQIGQVTNNDPFVIKGQSGKKVVNASINSLLKSYKSTLGEY
jgi:phosphoribosylformylglycinamidine synthase subunit PurSL